MAYSEALAKRLQKLLADQKVTEKQMFGGLAFMTGGHMFIGIIKDDLMVRVGPGRHAAALAQKHVRPMDFAGRPMAGYVYVAPEGIKSDAALEKWIAQALENAGSLPPKGEKKKRAKK